MQQQKCYATVGEPVNILVPLKKIMHVIMAAYPPIVQNKTFHLGGKSKTKFQIDTSQTMNA